jgi:mycothiol synthase
MITDRPATSLDDLRAADGLMSRAWLAGSPLVAATPAGIEWWYASSWPDELADHLRIWAVDGRGVAWTWHDGPELEWHVWSGNGATDAAVLERILDRAVERSTGPTATYAPDDDAVAIRSMEAHGFAATDRRLSQWQFRPATDSVTPTDPPAGYTIRPLAGPDEIEPRVDVHRAAFAPSRLTREKYERLVTLPHYRFDDDLVVEAGDGTFAAFAMAWWDPVGRVGEFEPVGTHPDHQRRGLGRALLAWAIDRFIARGATVVQVYSDAANAASESLYASVGFRRRAFHRRYERPGPARSDLQSDP